MIRERRAADLDRLCEILATLKFPASAKSVRARKDWLEEYDAEQSWVFDMAPVRVAPTKNVVGHVQVYRPTAELAMSVSYTEKSAAELLAIGKLFVRPYVHDYGIARYLLKESVRYVRERGMLPVLDLNGNGFRAAGFYEKFGFEAVPSDDPTVAPMIYAG